MAERSLDELWPDPDRRDEALLRLLCDVHRAEVAIPELPPEILTPTEARVLTALSQGLGGQGAADALGVSWDSVKDHAKRARRKLQARDTTHACCEALRRGLIT